MSFSRCPLHFLQVAAYAGALLGCRDSGQRVASAAPLDHPDSLPIPMIGARVRAIVPSLGPGWRVGMLNATRQEPPCYLVLLFDPGPIREVAVTVPIRAISRLQLSRLYPGSPADPDPGAAAFDAEVWDEVALDSAQRTGVNCADSVPRG